jgi:hypothetical protein
MIERFEKKDLVILAAAAVLALGAFLPVVRLPLVGSMNLMAGGRGDGILIIGAALLILALICTGHSKATGGVAIVVLFGLAFKIIQIISILGEANAKLSAGPKDAFTQGLGKIVMSSIGIEWGWFPLLAAPITILGVVMTSSGGLFPMPRIAIATEPVTEPVTKGNADALIQAYLEHSKRNPTTTGPTAFGKRNLQTG